MEINKLLKRHAKAKTIACEPGLLLHPNIPQPLHGVSPRVIMGNRWWQATRQATYKVASYHCLACGVSKLNARYRQWLEAHEVYKVDYLLGRSYYLRTVPLCVSCHNYIHSGRLAMLLGEGKITHTKYTQILIHGDSVLQAANLPRPVPYNGPMAVWGDWRLVFEGKEYPPKFKTQQEWEASHNE